MISFLRCWWWTGMIHFTLRRFQLIIWILIKGHRSLFRFGLMNFVLWLWCWLISYCITGIFCYCTRMTNYCTRRTSCCTWMTCCCTWWCYSNFGTKIDIVSKNMRCSSEWWRLKIIWFIGICLGFWMTTSCSCWYRWLRCCCCCCSCCCSCVCHQNGGCGSCTGCCCTSTSCGRLGVCRRGGRSEAFQRVWTCLSILIWRVTIKAFITSLARRIVSTCFSVIWNNGRLQSLLYSVPCWSLQLPSPTSLLLLQRPPVQTQSPLHHCSS